MKNLTLNQNNAFRILQLTDIHIGDYPFHASDLLTFKLIHKMLTEIKPDLIIVTGDMIWSDGVKHPAKAYKALVNVFNAHDIPVMIVYGNHDAEDKTTKKELLNWEQQLRNSVLKKHEEFSDIDNRNDFVVELNDQNGQLVCAFFGMDSGAFSNDSSSKYDWLTHRQIKRFTKINQHYVDQNVGALIFQHIPICEYWRAINVIEHGVFEDDDNISCPTLNTGFFSHLVLANNVLGVFVGHDHDNNFCGTVHGIKLCYGNVTGYQAYGKLNRGGRIIDLHLNNNVLSMDTSIVSYEKSEI